MSDLWITEYENALEEWDAGKTGKLTAIKRLKALGLGTDEIRCTMRAYDEAKRMVESVKKSATDQV